MTTYIDFRYSQTLASAMFAGQDVEERQFDFVADRDGFLAFEVRGPASERPLASFATADGRTVASLRLDADGAVALVRASGETVVQVDDALTHGDAGRIVVLHLGTRGTGLRSGDRVDERAVALFPGDGGALRLAHEDGERLRVMGRGSGRAARWAELAYRRGRPTGLQVTLAMDWHHLRAGIPWFGTMTAENLIAQGDFKLALRSYAYDDAQAKATDFARLFDAPGSPDIVTHLSPPLYAAPESGVANLGFFVVESRNVQADLVRRCNRMDAICVPSRFAGDACRDAGVRRPIHVVPHGVDLDFHRPVAERRSLPDGRGFNFLAVCSHMERKNAKHLVRAFLEEFRAREDVALFLLLRPEYHTSQQNVALEFTAWERRYDRDSAPVLLWTDYVSSECLRDCYANADAYVMPSNEGFGLTLLEAMACGTPVIALDHGGVTDFVNRDNGWLVPAGRPYLASDVDMLPVVGERYLAPHRGRLRATMREVFENRAEAQRRADRARRDCEARYAWDRVTRDFAQVIAQTHDQARRHGSAPARAGEPASDTLAWVLGVDDDEPCQGALDELARSTRDSRARVLVLFTRYARLRDVLQARRHGFLLYRWDATPQNARRIARTVLGSGWIGMLHPGERVDGDLRAFAARLTALPADVGEVTVVCGSDAVEGRFLRIDREGRAGEVLHAPELRIAGAAVRR